MAEGDGKTEQLETLVNGEHSDNHPSLQPENTFRQGLNGNLINKGGNNYSYESQAGTIVSFTLPEHIYKSGVVFIPIGIFPMGNQLIVHSTYCEDYVGADGEIGIVTIDQYGQGTYLCIYYHKKLYYTQTKMMGNEGYCLAENDGIKRNYYTDDFNQPRVINVANPIWTKYYTDAVGQLEVGKSYMVLTNSYGSVTYDNGSGAIEYGPLQPAGNVFTCEIGGNSYYTIVGGSFPLVIAFVDPRTFDYTPQKSLDTIRFKSWGRNGSIISGIKLYCYQLYTNDGYYSSWSFSTNPVSVSRSIPGSASMGVTGFEGNAGTVNSLKSITMTIRNLPNYVFQAIRVAVIEVNEDYEVISDVEVFWDTEFTGTEIDVTHYGNENIETLTIDQVKFHDEIILKCKTMTTTKQRQEIANITTVEYFDAPKVAETITPIRYLFPADASTFGADWQEMKNLSVQPKSGVISGEIRPDGIYVVRGISMLDYVEYPSGSGNNYGPGQTLGDTFVGVLPSDPQYNNYSPSGAPIVKACIRLVKYYQWDSIGMGYTIPVYDIIELEDEYFGYTSMPYTEYLRGYWRDETYRFARVFFDKFGNALFAEWIGDCKMPNQSDSWYEDSIIRSYQDLGPYYIASLSAMGVQIDNIDITDYIDKIGGVAIVRCRRDKTVFAQGLLQQVTNWNNNYVPMNDVVPAEDQNVVNNGNKTNAGIWGVLSPELDFGLPNGDPLPLLSGDSLKAVLDLEPLNAFAGMNVQPYDVFLNMAAGVGNSEIYSKFYMPQPFSPTSDDVEYNPIQVVATVPSGGNANIAGTNFLNDSLKSIAGHNNAPHATAGGALQSRTSRGGQRTAIKTTNGDFVNASNANQGTGVNAADKFTQRKLLVNYTRRKNQLYGGTSEAALAANEYIFTGCYIPIDDAMLSTIKNKDNRYILNGLMVFGGDCFVNLYDRVNTLFDDNGGGQDSMSWGCVFPVESEINVALRSGETMGTIGLVKHGGIKWKYNGNGPRLENFTYNKAYSSENAFLKYYPKPFGFIPKIRYPYINRYSEQKVLGEIQDNMRRFLTNNFINVDATHGEVTHIDVMNDFLIGWQERGVYYLPINEREVVSTTNAGATQIGVGGVMDRFDTKDYFYGCVHKHSVGKTESGFFWWDAIRRAILALQVDGKPTDITILKGKQSFYQDFFDPNTLPAKNTFDIYRDEPLMGFGVIGYFDPRFHTAFLTFLNVKPIDNIRHRQRIDFTQGINSTLDKFVGTSNFAPSLVACTMNYLFAVRKTCFVDNLYGLYGYNVGDQWGQDGYTYICTSAYTTDFDPNNPPDDSTHWALVEKANNIHVFWEGLICNFFGVTYPFELTKIFGANSMQVEKAFDNIEIYGDKTAFTDVYYENSEMTAQDINIQSSNKNFGYINNAWYFNVALTNKGQRLFDRYLQIRVVVKNYQNNPLTSLNQIKRIVYLCAVNRLKK